MGFRILPYVFTEQGIAMLSTALRSDTAITVSIQIMNAFVEMRRFLRENSEVLVRLDNVERKHVILQHETNKKFDQVFNALQSAHDRFLIIDGTSVYHIGASLKDLGAKWFAFSKMEMSALGLLSKL